MADITDERASLLDDNAKRNQDDGIRRKSGKYAVSLICVSFMFERFVFYCCLQSPNILLKKYLHYNETDSVFVTIPMLFIGTATFLAVFGGVLADSVKSLGSIGCIFIGGIIYLIGTVVMLLPLALGCIPKCHSEISAHQLFYNRIFYFVGLFISAVGSAIYKPNITVFCGKQTSHFFDGGGIKTVYALLYWFGNVGVMLSAIVVYQLEVTNQTTSSNIEYLFVFAVAAIVLSQVLFYVGAVKVYVQEEDLFRKPSLFQIFKMLCCKNLVPERIPSAFNVFRRNQEHQQSREQQKLTAKQVVLLTTMFATFIMYWAGYSQMFSSYIREANVLFTTMKYDFGIIFINFCDSGFIILLIPLVYIGLYKGLEKCGVSDISMLTRMGIGIFMMMLSVVVAGVAAMINLSTVWVLLLQTMLVAAGEVFAAITGLEFAFSQAPGGLEGTIMGLYMCSMGLASLLGTPLTLLINQGPFMFTLACLVAVSFVIFIFIARKYQYVSQTPTANVEDITASTNHTDL